MLAAAFLYWTLFAGQSRATDPSIIFTELATRTIQSISCDVRLSVPSWKPRFSVDWRLLVKEHIANISIPLDVLFFAVLLIFCILKKKFFFGVFANHSTVHSGGVSRGRVCGCGCWR